MKLESSAFKNGEEIPRKYGYKKDNVNPPLEIKDIPWIENSVPENSIQGKTDFGEIAYGGPAPPDKEHTYVFKLYALDSKLDLKEGSSKAQVEDSMKSHVISEAKLEGRYAP